MRESRDRVRAAIQCAQFEFPSRRITVNLAPADLPKDGGRFDLPIAHRHPGRQRRGRRAGAVAIRTARRTGADGELRPIDAVLPAALAAAAAGRALIVPDGNGEEAALAGNGEAFTARTLLEVVAHINGGKALPRAPECSRSCRGVGAASTLPMCAASCRRGGRSRSPRPERTTCFSLVLPAVARRCSRRGCPGLLPEASEAEALERAVIASVSGHGLDLSQWRQRSFRSPHHTASAIALIGGGSPPRPGEVSLAHNGVLFLDELAEWGRRALEVLRQPLESGVVTVSRACGTMDFPARFQLVAAMNPCPCGWAGDPSGRCRCTVDTRAALPRPTLRTAARPDRPAGSGAEAGAAGDARRCAPRRIDAVRARARARGARATAVARGQDQCAPGAVRDRT